MSRLATKPETFNATRCSACSASLDLPTVHFLCKHSFHQRCLNTPPSSPAFGAVNTTTAINSLDAAVVSPSGTRTSFLQDSAAGAEDDGTECPICAPQNATIRAIRKAQEESASRHDLFLDALGRSKDKFGTVSEWFGRGVMSAGNPGAGVAE
jgi:hypothetical protein